jgi:serine/threonine protein kinase
MLAAVHSCCRHSQGSLRDALDCNLLSKPGSFLAPSTVLALAHDIAAAMLHLHCEGIVHGDLKAGNVMLTSSSSSSGGAGGLPSVRMWSAAGEKALTAKVADFGLALPLGPTDTHATLLARVGGSATVQPASRTVCMHARIMDVEAS